MDSTTPTPTVEERALFTLPVVRKAARATVRAAE